MMERKALPKRTIASIVMILLLIPLTIYLFWKSGNRNYLLVSLLIVMYTMIPFFMVFEARSPQAREIVVIAVMCAIAVAARAAFIMVPHFKPMGAIVMITAVAFGPEAGFLTGAVSVLASNFIFGQGPWTPWQMFAFGILGFLAGLMFKKGLLRKTKASLCAFGAFAVLFIYGPLMNFSTMVLSQAEISLPSYAASSLSGIPFVPIHAASTAFFLWFISEEMIEKLERIKLKKGLF